MTMVMLLDGQAPEPRLAEIAARMTEHRYYSHKRVADVRPLFSSDGRVVGTIWRIEQKAWAQATQRRQAGDTVVSRTRPLPSPTLPTR